MKNGICPNCQSNDIHSNTFDRSRSLRPLSLAGIGSLPLDIYICGNCGHVEYYIASDYDLKKITEKWPRLAQAPSLSGEEASQYDHNHQP